MSIQSMTFQENYGSLPTRLLSLYRRVNVSPADHDSILAAFNCTWDDESIPWDAVYDYVVAGSESGSFRQGRWA